MTNEMIIYNVRCQLMDEGKIGTTGHQITVKDENGNDVTMMEPEEIHTYARWKALGFQVKKGEHAVASFNIWKCSMKHETLDAKDKDGNDTTIEQDSKRMFHKMSHFFASSQVERIA